jgi:opacity protein-like surface antigen
MDAWLGRGKDEAMVSVKTLIRAGAATLISTAAYAADLPPPAPMYQPQIAYQAPPAVAETSGWYLRGDVGVGMNSANLQFLQNPLNSSNFAFDHSSIADTTFIGGGIGYELNNWFRFDATAEYRSKTQVNAFGLYTFGGGTFGDQYQANLTSVVALANAYVDLGTWWCLTPYVGAGVGGAYNSLVDFDDIGIATSGAGTGPSVSKWSPAWALYAGVDYNVTQNLKVGLSYRYLNYGSITDSINCIGGCNPDSYKWSGLTSQDIMLGFRWMLQPEPVPVMVPAPPLMSRG